MTIRFDWERIERNPTTGEITERCRMYLRLRVTVRNCEGEKEGIQILREFSKKLNHRFGFQEVQPWHSYRQGVFRGCLLFSRDLAEIGRQKKTILLFMKKYKQQLLDERKKRCSQ